MRILHFPAAWLHEELGETIDDFIDIFLTEAYHSPVVDDDVREESVRLLIGINLLRRVLLLAALVAPLETTHGDDADDHDWGARHCQQGHPPRDEHCDEQA